MANSLLPDLNSEQTETKKSKAAKIIAEFDYDNTNSEVDGAMKTFQYNFSSKRWILSIVAYSLLMIAAVVMIIVDPTMYFVYAALLICIGGLYLSVTAKKRMRKKVIQALDSMDPETYHCRIYPKKIEIETLIRPRENTKKDDPESSEKSADDSEEAAENSESSEGSEIKPIMSVFTFKEDMLDFAENRDSLLLVVGRRQFYCFPKRCLTEEQQNTIRDFLSENTGNMFGS